MRYILHKLVHLFLCLQLHQDIEIPLSKAIAMRVS